MMINVKVWCERNIRVGGHRMDCSGGIVRGVGRYLCVPLERHQVDREGECVLRTVIFQHVSVRQSQHIIAGVPDRHYAVRSALHTFGASDAAGRHSRRHSVLSRPDFERLLSFRVQYTSICILQVNIVVRYVLYYCYYACKYS